MTFLELFLPIRTRVAPVKMDRVSGMARHPWKIGRVSGRLVYIGGILKVCGGAATIGGPPISKLRLTLTFGWLWSFVIAPQASNTSARGARARLKQDRPPPKCLGIMGARPLAPYIHKPSIGYLSNNTRTNRPGIGYLPNSTGPKPAGYRVHTRRYPTL